MEHIKKRGRKPLDDDDKRTHRVSCWLSSDELAALNRRRGAMTRGAYLRLAAFERIPPEIPEINRTAYAELARAQANLSQIAKKLNTGAVPEIDEIRAMLADLRRSLIAAQQR